MSNRLTWCQDGYVTENQGEYIAKLEAKIAELQREIDDKDDHILELVERLP